MAELTVEERAARRQGLGASDAGPVFGMGYQTPFGVWADKVWGHEVTVTPWMQRGHDLESLVMAKWVERTGEAWVEDGRHRSHHMMDWLRATTDYELPGGDLRAPLECKVVDRFAASNWGPDGDPDGVPGHYELQARQQAIVLDGGVAHVAALFVDTWELRTYTVEADDKITGLLLDGLEAFWVNHVVARVPPPITDPAKDWDALKSIPLEIERQVELPVDAGELIRTWREARDDRKAAETVEKECKAELGRLLDGAGVGLINGAQAVTASEYYRGTTLVRKLADVKQWRNEND